MRSSPHTWFQNQGRRPASRRTARAAALWSGAALAVYLVGANFVLQTRWLRDRVSEGPDRELEYADAYSLLPGRVVFRDLRLVAQGHRIQFAIAIDEGSVDINLFALLAKRLQASGLRASGTSFRLRTKVRDALQDARRLSAYPPIPGYPDPPLQTRREPQPVSDDEYDLWEIAVEDVDAELVEVWLHEYRYLGGGSVTGGFELRPARWFQVYPARLELDGALHVGDVIAARELEGSVECAIAHTDVTGQQQMSVTRSLSARLELEGDGIDLRVAQMHLPEWMRVESGVGRARAAFEVLAGELLPGGRADIGVYRASLGTADEVLRGSVFATSRTGAEGEVRVSVFAPWLEAGPAGSDVPATARNSAVNFRVDARDLARAPALTELEAQLPRVELRSLGVADAALRRAGVNLELEGRLDAEAELVWAERSPPIGHAAVRVVGGAIEHGDLAVTFAGRARLGLGVHDAGLRRSRGQAAVELDAVRVRRSGQVSEPFRAAIRTTALDVRLGPELSVSAPWQVTAAPAAPLLSLAIGAPLLEELADGLLGLDRLDARAQLDLDVAGLRLELASARSGALHGEGYWQRRTDRAPTGAFLVATSLARVGIELNGSNVDTEFPVEEDWLEQRGTGSTSDSREPPAP